MTAFSAVPGNEVANAREGYFPIDAPVCGVRRIIGYVIGADLYTGGNNTDIPITLLLLPGANFKVVGFEVNNASTDVSATVTLGLYSASAGGGKTLVTAANLTNLDNSTANSIAMTIATAGTRFQFINATTALGNTTALGTAGTLYARVGTAFGSAATADLWVWGDVYL